MKTLKLFVRQAFTETGEADEKIIQDVLDELQNFRTNNFNLEFLTDNIPVITTLQGAKATVNAMKDNGKNKREIEVNALQDLYVI